MSQRASGWRGLVQGIRAFAARAQLDLFGTPAAPPPAARQRRRPAVPAPTGGRWEFTRPWQSSPHLARAQRELDLVRDHFPELDGVTVRVGLTKRRGVLGLASLGKVPMIWVRPRRLRRFAIAHELTHLLHARGLVPGGEKTCDLYTLARSAAFVDVAPFYLKVPAAFHEGGAERYVPAAKARALHALAKDAVAGRSARSAIIRFERAVHAAGAIEAVLP